MKTFLKKNIAFPQIYIIKMHLEEKACILVSNVVEYSQEHYLYLRISLRKIWPLLCDSMCIYTWPKMILYETD